MAQSFQPPPGSPIPGLRPPPPGALGWQIGPKPSHPRAVLALVMSIMSWLFCPLFAGVAGLILGLQARRLITENTERWNGSSLALAAMIVGGINAGLYLLMGLAYVGMILFAIIAGVASH